MSRAALLARLAALLAAVIVAEVFLVRPGGDAPPAPARPAFAVAAAPQTRAGPPVDELVDDVLARPVFSVSRRPAPEAVAAPQSVAGPAGLPRLTGILIGGGVKNAIFAGGADGKPVVVAEQGKIGAYVVQSIDVDRATVLGPSGSQVLRPAFDPSAAPAQPAAQPVFFPQGAAPPPPPQPPPGSPGQPSVLDLLRKATPRVSIPGLNPLPQAPEQ